MAIRQSGNQAIRQSGNQAIRQSGNHTHLLTNRVNYLIVVYLNLILIVLLSCILEPVDLEGFVNSLPKPEIVVDIEYEVSDESPRLQWNHDGGPSWVDLSEKSTITIDLADPAGTVIIRVIDQSDYAGISWYCDSTAALTAAQGVEGANDERLKIIPGTAPFTEAKTYQMAVVGMKGGQRYGTIVFIRVVGNTQ